MEDMEKPGFDDALKNAFDGAGIPPSSSVWNNIETELIRSEDTDLRRRLFYYKMVAAASLIFALTVAGFGWLYMSQTVEQQIAMTNDPVKSDNVSGNNESVTPRAETPSNSELVSPQMDAKEKTTSILSEKHHDHVNADNSIAVNSAEDVSNKRERKIITATGQFNETINQNLSLAELDRPELYEHKAIRPSIPQRIKQTGEADPVALMLARLEQRERELSDMDENEKDRGEERIWTSVGFAAGAFDGGNTTVAQPSASSLMSTSSATVNNEASASGVSYSLGLNLGTKLSDKWVLQGGVNYLTQNSSYGATSVIGSPNSGTFLPASTNGLTGLADAEKEDAKVVSTAPYNVNNSLRFLSVPLQAGYLLVDKKVGFQLNAGLSTDLFLRNSKTAEGGSLQDIKQGRDDDSPYRAVNFSGLMGVELSYRIAERYRVALNPGLRYPFNSIYREDTGVKSMPLSYDIGLRFRYIFQ